MAQNSIATVEYRKAIYQIVEVTAQYVVLVKEGTEKQIKLNRGSDRYNKIFPDGVEAIIDATETAQDKVVEEVTEAQVEEPTAQEEKVEVAPIEDAEPKKSEKKKTTKAKKEQPKEVAEEELVEETQEQEVKEEKTTAKTEKPKLPKHSQAWRFAHYGLGHNTNPFWLIDTFFENADIHTFVDKDLRDAVIQEKLETGDDKYKAIIFAIINRKELKFNMRKFKNYTQKAKRPETTDFGKIFSLLNDYLSEAPEDEDYIKVLEAVADNEEAVNVLHLFDGVTMEDFYAIKPDKKKVTPFLEGN